VKLKRDLEEAKTSPEKHISLESPRLDASDDAGYQVTQSPKVIKHVSDKGVGSEMKTERALLSNIQSLEERQAT
jgi:hypothetical protein